MTASYLDSLLLDRLVVDAAAAWGERQAIVFEDGEQIDFAGFARAVERRAGELAGLGVAAGDKVGLYMPNSIDYLASFFAAARLAAIPIPINSRFHPRELAGVIGHGEVSVLLTAAAEDGDYPATLETVLESLAGDGAEASRAPCLRHVVLLSGGERAGFRSREELARGAIEPGPPPSRQPTDPAVIMFTSGTTATPKGCVLNHRGILGNARLSAETRFLLTGEDRFWDPLPFFHMSTILPFCACLYAGSTFVAMRRFEAGAALEQLERERCTFAYPCFEAIAASLFNHPAFAATDLSRVTRSVNVGLPVRLRAMQEQLPWAVQLSSYGMTELSGILTYNAPDDPLEKRIEAVGRPFEGMEARIVDPETGRELPPGTKGEMTYRGFARFDGYYKDPEATAAAIDADGWMHSGDHCSIDAEGYVSYHGRLKDMLKVGGENVAAAEVEGVLSEHPAVKVAQVVAAPDARYEEVAAAYVELLEGRPASEEELIAFCAERLAKFKVPRYVRFVEDWPLSGTKVQKEVLRRRITDELERAGITEAPRIAALS